MKRSLLILVFLVALVSCNSGQNFPYLDNTSGLAAITSENGITSPVTFHVVYDNYLKNNELEADWGFSVLVSGLPKTILFDTGTSPDIFISNFRKMNLDATTIDYLVLSHEHGDHTGGIPGLMKLRKGLPVIIPQSFSTGTKNNFTQLGLEPILVNSPAAICDNLYTSGEFSGPVREQALVLNTPSGLVVITGCSHPGIVRMLKEIKSSFNKNVYMVFGGFHLMDKSDGEVSSIITGMKEMGVVKCGATHCTGDHQIDLFRKAFGDNFVEMGVGNSITVN